MAYIKTKLNVGDTVWWAHCSNKIYKGTVEEISCCDYQGALYCQIYSPSFRRNPYPTVHYSNVFKSKDDAKEFAEYQKANPDGVLPMCNITEEMADVEIMLDQMKILFQRDSAVKEQRQYKVKRLRERIDKIDG